jgi:hypothetical protein
LDELGPDDQFHRIALYLLVKLSANSHKLPASLFVRGVDIGPVRDASHGGGFADIYLGQHAGIAVAVKKLRFSDEEQRVHAHRVSRRFSFQHGNHLTLPT